MKEYPLAKVGLTVVGALAGYFLLKAEKKVTLKEDGVIVSATWADGLVALAAYVPSVRLKNIVQSVIDQEMEEKG